MAFCFIGKENEDYEDGEDYEGPRSPCFRRLLRFPFLKKLLFNKLYAIIIIVFLQLFPTLELNRRYKNKNVTHF